MSGEYQTRNSQRNFSTLEKGLEVSEKTMRRGFKNQGFYARRPSKTCRLAKYRKKFR